MKVKDMAQLMGKVVTITALLCRKEGPYQGGARKKEWVRFNKDEATPRFGCREIGKVGWVVGFRNLQNGETVYGCMDEPNHWEGTSTIPCILVALKPNTKPIPVPLDGFILGGTPDLSLDVKWSEQARQDMRDEMKDRKRDSKGRWLNL